MNGEASSPLDDNYTRPRHAFMLPDAIPEEDEDVDDDEEYQVDDRIDIANRAFVATCKKFARQAEFRRRAAYSFLETYHLHCIYSKSQQILLGIPDAVPVVMFMGDDFMFTPQLVQQQHFDRMQQDYWQEDEDDTTQHSPIMDENAWMSSHHHVANEEETREDGQEEEEEQHYTPLSQEVIHWYRSAQFHQRRPSTILEEEEEEEENESETKTEEYESLADMFPSPPPVQPEVAQETVIAMPTEEEGYGTIKSRQINDEGGVIRNYFDTYYASTRLAETAWLVLDTADMLTQDKQSIPFRQFTRYMVNVWRILFFCVETMLSDLGGLFVSKAS
ncbi:hypothetical protein BJV82DRAFT_663805 [Fennellomyces sp. T-0311]|nr:hypothetical protein BJV82DRAFT_663805 [Fennellomyces sp. T-0311]